MPVRPAALHATPSMIEQVLLAALFLALVAVASLPGARAASAGVGWVPLWLLALPACSLAVAFALRRRRQAAAAASQVPAAFRRRRASTAATTAARRATPQRWPRIARRSAAG